jgi:hypothetical protein
MPGWTTFIGTIDGLIHGDIAGLIFALLHNAVTGIPRCAPGSSNAWARTQRIHFHLWAPAANRVVNGVFARLASQSSDPEYFA